MSVRRLFASLIAVLCIAGWVGLGSATARRSTDEVTALAGSGAAGCHSIESKAQPRSPAPPRGGVLASQLELAAPGPGVVLSPASRAVAPLVARGGEPGAPRGPPSSFVVI